ncbi:MAG: hypothetical protein KGJ55_12295, partial [Gammaproteobacteria bacterium]|nr:hypothetical protein [Gammaproteobacteria bacterium]
QRAGGLPDGAAADAARALQRALAPLIAEHGATLPPVNAALAALATDLESADAAPTQGQTALYRDQRAALDRLLARWTSLRDGDLVQLDALLAKAGQAPITLPPPERIPAAAPDAGHERP